jgi:hypothetical protein
VLLITLRRCGASSIRPARLGAPLLARESIPRRCGVSSILPAPRAWARASSLEIHSAALRPFFEAPGAARLGATLRVAMISKKCD